MCRGTITSSVGEKIKKLREGQGLTQAELAERVALEQSHISKLEHGRTAGSLESIKKIAGALGVSVGFLLEEVDWPPPKKG